VPATPAPDPRVLAPSAAGIRSRVRDEIAETYPKFAPAGGHAGGRREPQAARPRKRAGAERRRAPRPDPARARRLQHPAREVRMRQQFEREMGAKDLRPPEFSTLVLIAANPLATQAEVAQAPSAPEHGRADRRLEERGLITRTV
jgi:hypothetical protein